MNEQHDLMESSSTIVGTTTAMSTANNQLYQQTSRLPAAAAAAGAADTCSPLSTTTTTTTTIAADVSGEAIEVVNEFNQQSSSLSSSSHHHQQQQQQQKQYHHQQQQQQQQQLHLNNELSIELSLGNLPTTKPQERYVWEMRTRSPNVTPASTVLNSPDLNTDTMQYALHHPHHAHQLLHQHQRQHQHHQIRVGHSPGSQFEQHDILPQGLASPGSPTDVGKGDGRCLRDGEIVVFDDIDTNWMNKTSVAATSSSSSVAVANGFNRDLLNTSMGVAASLTPSTAQQLEQQHYQQQVYHNNEDVLKVTKMIGQLPIAEYEGSPRRFGNHSVSSKIGTPMNYPKRPPGFPLRVSPNASQTQQQQQQQQRYYSNMANEAAGNNNNNVDDNNKSSMGNLIDLVDHDDQNVYNAARQSTSTNKTPTFDYLYEFSETRKVLEEFFKANPDDEKRFTDFTESGDDVASLETQQDCVARLECEEDKHIEQAYIGQRLARIPKEELYLVHRSPKKQTSDNNVAYNEHNDIELYIDSNSRSSGDLADTELEANLRRHSRNFTLSPETTDYDSNCGDLDSLSNDINCPTDYGKLYTSMPVLEDGLSSGHASDTENNVSVICDKQQQQIQQQQQQQQQHQQQMLNENEYNASFVVPECTTTTTNGLISDLDAMPHETQQHQQQQQQQILPNCNESLDVNNDDVDICCSTNVNAFEVSTHYGVVYAAAAIGGTAAPKQSPPPPPAPVPHRPMRSAQPNSSQPQRTAESVEIQEAMKEIRSALQRAKTQPEKLKFCDEVLPPGPDSPVWVPRKNTSLQQALVASSTVPAAVAATTTATSNNLTHRLHCSSSSNGGVLVDEEEADTDLETDRLLGQQRLDEQDFFDEKNGWPKTSQHSSVDGCEQTSASDFNMLNSTLGGGVVNINNGLNNVNCSSSGNAGNCIKPQGFSTATIRQGIGTSLTPNSPDICQIVGNADVSLSSPEKLQYSKSPTGSIKSLKDSANSDKKAKSRNKEGLLEPKVLIEGVLFRARYLGSTQLVCEGQPTKSTRMMQAEEAVSRIKAPEGESQPSTEVDLFISTEKIMVLNTDLKEIMMDHALRTISYIADIGDLVVLMARRRFVPNSVTAANGSGINADACNSDTDAANGVNKDNKDSTVNNNVTNGGGGGGGGNGSNNTKHNRTPKMICHVFESDEAQFIAQSIGQAFQVAYMEFLKANGIENESLAKEMDYQEVLNSQEIFGDELEIFAKKELQKEVVVPKAKGEILGVVIVESGWGSMLPTVVIANLMSGGAAARCGQLNIGDQLIAINGMSLVGLPLSTCQSYIRNAKNQTAVKFTVVPCPPVVEVKILRPKALFQLGFSVQNGVICSLLRGGIAERGGVRVGHRIIEINNQSVVAVPHDTIVKLLSSSVGEILMKTMPTSMFRLLTGQETPIYI